MIDNLDFGNLNITEAKSIICYTRRLSFEVISPCVGYNIGDICVFTTFGDKSHLLNLSSYSNMIIDKFNCSLMSPLRLKAISLCPGDLEDINHSIVSVDSFIKPFESQIYLDSYITKAYLEASIGRLKDDRFSKDTVIKFLELLLERLDSE